MTEFGFDADDVLEDFDKATPSSGRSYVKPGGYLMLSKSLELKKGDQGVTFIGTNEVVKVLRDSGDSNSEGEEANVVENFTKHPKTAPGNTKGYVLGLAEGKYQQKIPNPKTIKKEFLKTACGPDQPLRSIYVFCDAEIRAAAWGGIFLHFLNFTMIMENMSSKKDPVNTEEPPVKQKDAA